MPELIRQASWREVEAVIDEADAVRNANGWADRFKRAPSNWPGCVVTLEAWMQDEIGELMDAMARIEPRMTVDMVGGLNNATLPPRLDGMPLALVRFGDRFGMIDGKHRANRWRHVHGRYAALVIHA